MLDKVKLALRLKNDAFDEGEILPLVEACKRDMRLRGVAIIDDSDPLVVRAATLYVKAHFGYSDESERFEKGYAALVDSMTICGDYSEG